MWYEASASRTYKMKFDRIELIVNIMVLSCKSLRFVDPKSICTINADGDDDDEFSICFCLL